VESIKIVHTADNHLDPKVPRFRHRVMERKRDFWKSFMQVINYTLEARPDILLISGDLFDRVDPRNPPRTEVIRALRRVKEHGTEIFIICGNHDGAKSVLEGMSPIAEIEAAGFIHFFPSINEVEAVNLNIRGYSVCISGVSYNHSLHPGEDPLEKLTIPLDGDINIFMMHYPLEGIKYAYYGLEPVVKKSSIPRGLHYVASGHIHSYTKMSLGRTLVVYPGSTERLTFLEEKDADKGFVYAELNNEYAQKVDFIRVNSRTMKTIRVNISENVPNISAYIKGIIKKYEDSDIIFRLIVSGKVPISKLLTYSRDEIYRYALNKFFMFELSDIDLMPKDVLQPSRVVRTLSPIEAFKEYIMKLMENTEDDEERSLLEEVLKLGISKLKETGGF